MSQAPAQLTLTFSEPVEIEHVSVELYDTHALPVPLQKPRIMPGNASGLVVDLPAMKPGGYTVLYRLLSEDGHPVTGSYTFSIGERLIQPRPPMAEGHSQSDPLPARLIRLRAVTEGALLVGAGCFWIWQLLIWRGYSFHSGITARFMRVGMLFVLAALFLQALFYYGTISSTDSSWAWSSPFFLSLLAQCMVLLLLLVPGMVQGWYLLLSIFLIAIQAASGHVWGLDPWWMALLLRLLHLFGIALWLGTLLVLLLSLWKNKLAAWNHSPSFRPVMLTLLLFSSLAVAVSGMLMTAVQTNWEAIISSQSGWSLLLAGKTTLLLIMLLFALRQHLRWRGQGILPVQSLLAWELFFGLIAIVLGVWMSQSAYPLPPADISH